MRSSSRLSNVLLKAYAGLVFAFLAAPLVASLVFSLNSDRYPSLPLGGFSTQWYAELWNDHLVWEGLANTLAVVLVVATASTFIGFTAAYTVYRHEFTGRSAYLALALLPPTVPLAIFGLAMLAYLSRLGLSGGLVAVGISHVVLCAPFAMAICRLRLLQMDPSLEAAGWNLGAGQWRALSSVIIPFCRPALLASLFICAALSFDEFAVAWFVGGLEETLPVRVLNSLQGQVSPRINAIGTLVSVMSVALVLAAQAIMGLAASRPKQEVQG